MRPSRCHDSSGTNHQVTWRYIPEERRNNIYLFTSYCKIISISQVIVCKSLALLVNKGLKNVKEVVVAQFEVPPLKLPRVTEAIDKRLLNQNSQCLVTYSNSA
jgi:hypothetical protein